MQAIQTTDSRLVSLKVMANHLGISIRHVQNLRVRRLIPVIKLSSRCLRFRIAEVEAALEKLTEREVS